MRNESQRCAGAVIGGNRRRVLHVEDNASIARCTAAVLRRDALEVVSVTTAEAAIALLAIEHFDLVISDYDLAGRGTGADVLAAVRADLDRPPFLFVSGNDAVRDLGVPWLDKPASAVDLRAAIAALLAKAAA